MKKDKEKEIEEEKKNKEIEENKEKEIMEKLDKIIMDKDKNDAKILNQKLNNNKYKINGDFFTKNKYILHKNLKNENDIFSIKINENEIMTKTDSNENANLEVNLMPKIESSFLDQKILTDKEIKKEKEKKMKNEVMKKHFHNNLLNYKIISGNTPLDLYNYSTSVPKLSKNKKKENKLNKLNKYDSGKRLELKVKRDNLKSKSLTPLLYSKIKLKNFNLVNLELEENASVNPDTNNGAYIIAEKQKEKEKITRLEILPTSFVKVYDATKRSSRLLNMTFSKEALNMDKKYILKNEVNKNKNEV